MSEAAPIDDRSPVGFRTRLPGILFLATIFFCSFVARFIWSPLLVPIEREFAIQHTAAGSLFFWISSGYFLGLLSSGYFSHHFNHHRTVVISSISCGLVVFGAMLAPSAALLILALVGIGVTSGIYLPTGIVSLTFRLRPADFGKAFAFHEMAPSLGFIAGPLLAEAMLGWIGWRGVLLPIGLAALILGLGYGRKSWTGDLRGEPLSFGNLRFVLSRPPLWCLALPFLMGVCNNIGVFSMLPLYLQTERGLDQSFTNLLLSASRWAGMLSVTVTGWAVARFNPKAVAGAVLFLTGTATVGLGLVANRWIWLPLFVQSTLAPAFFPPAFAILTRIVPVSYRNLIVALIVAVCMLIGGGALPTIIGAFGDAGMFYAGFVLTGVITLASTGLLARLRLTDEMQA